MIRENTPIRTFAGRRDDKEKRVNNKKDRKKEGKLESAKGKTPGS